MFRSKQYLFSFVKDETFIHFRICQDLKVDIISKEEDATNPVIDVFPFTVQLPSTLVGLPK